MRFPHLAFFQTTLLRWFRSQGRDLPWRHTRDHYRILVSEIMLQQTQVDHVMPKYHAFLQKFPTARTLASAPTANVILAWSGLGYNRRALNLQRSAAMMVDRYGGKLPATTEELLALPGVGPYTAGALLSFAHRQDAPTLDTNIRRVIHRFFFGPEVPTPRRSNAQLFKHLSSMIPKGEGWTWNHGLMDLGALICTAKTPACGRCPLSQHCRSAFVIHPNIRRYYQKKKKIFEPSPASTPHIPNRIYRGRIVETLRQLHHENPLPARSLGKKIKPDYLPKEWSWLQSLLKGLEADGLIRMITKKRKTLITLP